MFDTLSMIVAVIQTVRNLLVLERERMFDALKEITFLEPLPSEANFIFCKASWCSISMPGIVVS